MIDYRKERDVTNAIVESDDKSSQFKLHSNKDRRGIGR